MKLLFYSIAVIAMCLLLACKSSNKELNETADSAAIGTTSNTTTQDMQLEKVQAPKPEENGNDKADNFAAATDTATQVVEQFTPPVLQAGNPINDWDKKIIKTARLTLELKDYSSFNKAMHEKLKRYGAYIAGEQQTESDTQVENTLTIKVPVTMFEDLMNSIGGDGIKVLEKNISTEDVTGEVVDTKARIAAKQQVRDRYMELLKQAKSMKDILAVQDEINSIQEDLESASGRVNYLSHNAAYSTINLTYYQYLNGNNANTVEPAFLTKVKDAFAAGATVISNIILFFISVWPLALAGVVLLIYVKRWKLKKI